MGGNGSKIDFQSLIQLNIDLYWSIFKFRAIFKVCPNSSVGSTLDIFPLILVDQRGREFKSTWRNNFFWPFFSVSNYINFYIYVICMLYSTQIRSQKVWVVYVYYRFILEQCVMSKQSKSIQFHFMLYFLLLDRSGPGIQKYVNPNHDYKPVIGSNMIHHTVRE